MIVRFRFLSKYFVIVCPPPQTGTALTNFGADGFEMSKMTTPVNDALGAATVVSCTLLAVEASGSSPSPVASTIENGFTFTPASVPPNVRLKPASATLGATGALPIDATVTVPPAGHQAGAAAPFA